MTKKTKIKVLFSDLGGVLLTNGWDRTSRAKAVELFGLDAQEFESRHQMLFGDYEVGKITLDTYLHYTVFSQPRSFSKEIFIDFMYSQSRPNDDTINLIRELKSKHGFKIVVISNEGKELTHYRTKTFDLSSFVDYFIVSCFIGIRKPDQNVYRLALNMVQVPAEETAYIDDRELFVEIARDFGIHAIHHRNAASTRTALEALLNFL
ncbi:MAG: HAD-IA family hydrolase [Parachlamydiaceae bacterium]